MKRRVAFAIKKTTDYHIIGLGMMNLTLEPGVRDYTMYLSFLEDPSGRLLGPSHEINISNQVPIYLILSTGVEKGGGSILIIYGKLLSVAVPDQENPGLWSHPDPELKKKTGSGSVKVEIVWIRNTGISW